MNNSTAIVVIIAGAILGMWGTGYFHFWEDQPIAMRMLLGVIILGAIYSILFGNKGGNSGGKKSGGYTNKEDESIREMKKMAGYR